MSTPSGRAVSAEGDPYGIAVAQRILDTALEARNADVVALCQAGATHADVAQLVGVTRSLVSRLMRAHADSAWGRDTPTVPARTADTYADRVKSLRHEYESLRHAAQLHAETRTLGHATELADYREARVGTPRDDLPIQVPSWTEYRKQASVSRTRTA